MNFATLINAGLPASATDLRVTVSWNCVTCHEGRVYPENTEESGIDCPACKGKGRLSGEIELKNFARLIQNFIHVGEY